MTTDPPQDLLPEQYHIESLSQLNQAVIENPQAVMNYIISLCEDRQKLNDIQKKDLRILEQSRVLEQRTKEKKRKEEIENALLSNWAVLEPLVFIIAVSAGYLILCSNITHGISPWSARFELLRKNYILARWHWIIPFSIIVCSFAAGCAWGYTCTEVSSADMEQDSLTFGIKRRVAQLPITSLNGKQKKDVLYVTRTQTFADYVGNMRAGSHFSRWQNYGPAYSLLVDLLCFCLLPHLNFEKIGRESGKCVGLLAKGGLMLGMLVFVCFAWVQGKVMGWHLGMGSLARRLRKECLRKSTELEKGEASGKDRLEALVRELLKEKMAGEGEKSEEELIYERTVIDSIVERIRC